MRAITGDKRPTANTTILVDDIFAQVSLVRNAKATGHESSTFLLPLLAPHFHRVASDRQHHDPD